MTMKITHAELEALHPDELLEVIDNMEETALFEGTLTQEQCTTNEQVRTWSTEARIQRILYVSNLEKEVQPKKSNDVLAEKIKYRNDLITEQAKEIEELKKANEMLKEKLNESADNKNELVNKIMDLKINIKASREDSQNLYEQLNEAKLENVEANKIIINQKLTIDSLTANVQRKRNLKVKSAEKINALIAENEELLNDNVEKTEKINDLCNLTTEIQRENQVIHTALYEEQEKNVNLEITIKTLTKMVK